MSGMQGQTGPTAGATIVPQTTRRFGPARLIALVLVVAVAGVGTALAILKLTQQQTPIETLAPAGAAAFLKITLEPSSDQMRAIDSILDRLPKERRDQLVPKIEKTLEDIFAEEGLSYRNDIKPWLGGQIGAVFELPQGAQEPVVVVIAAVTDEDAARRSLQKAASSQEFAFQVSDGAAYISDSRGQIDDLRSRAKREPLSDSDAYRRAIRRVGEDGLLHVWFDASAIDPAMLPTLPGMESATQTRGALGMRVEEERIVLAGYQSGGADIGFKTGRPAILESSSPGLLGAVTLFDLGAIAQRIMGVIAGFSAAAVDLGGEGDPLQQIVSPLGLNLERDVFSWLHGEFSVILGGLEETGPLVAAAAEVTDEAAATRTLDALGRNLGRVAGGGPGGASAKRVAGGLDVSIGGFQLAVRLRGGRLVIATPPQYADSLLVPSPDALGKDAAYRAVIGPESDNTSFLLFLRIDRLTSAIETFLPQTERTRYENDVAPYLQLFKALGIRATSSQGESEFTMIVSVE